MNRRQLSGMVFLLAVWLLWPTLADAQTGYYPSGGPISPWMNMFQRRPGPLDNYHSYVQPQLQLDSALRQQNAALQRHGANIRMLDQRITREGGLPIVPTGAGSVFMDYSHYYPALSGGNANRGPSGRGR